MRIALVDDDVKFLAQTARLLEILLDHRGTQAEVATFASADELLEARAETPFDMYLLDIVMPGSDGIALGRAIRRSQPDAPLLFFTTSRDFAVEAIGIEAVGYVVKPFTHEAFAESLERAFRRLATVRPPALMLKTSCGYVSLPLRELVCAETNGHYTTVRVSDGHAHTTRLSLQELWDRLSGDERFVCVGRSLLVNLECVKRYADGRVELSNGRAFVVPRRSLTEVKRAFARFYCT